jgi:hypothetical protein
MREGSFDGYIFVVDTDHYAGNFERPMTAYVTGNTGECEVGEEEAEMFKATVTIEIGERIDDIIESVPDDHGCCRPASIYPTPGFFNDGLGNEYPDADWGTDKVKEVYNKAAKEHGLTDSAPGRFPSYQSVAMFFSDKPEDDLLELMVNRTKEFCANHMSFTKESDPIKVLGIRLVKEQVIEEVVKRLL